MTEAVATRVKRYRNLLEPLREAPSEMPFATMWHPDQEPEFETVTFGRFLGRARRFAGLIRQKGVQAGEPVVLILQQGIDLMAAFAGAMLTGAIPTILAYPSFKVDPDKYRRGLAGVSDNIRARLVFLDAAFPRELLGHLGGRQEHAWVVSEAALEAVEPWSVWPGPKPGEVAFLQHSAGTTGLQKGVALSHGVVLNQLWELALALELKTEDRVASWLPLYHDMGLIACFVLPLVCHLPVVMQSPLDWVVQPISFLQLISRHHCTLGWIPNFGFQFLARRVPPEQRPGLDLSSLRALVTTSEPIRLHSMEEFRRAFRECGLGELALQTSYGMAENTFAVTQSRIDRPPPHLWVNRDRLQRDERVVPCGAEEAAAVSFVSCGRPLETAQIRIAGASGEDLGEGRVGEVVVRSRSMYSGYYNRPDLTSQVLRDGWYWTRDSGFLWDGELYAIGRKDDTIIVGGRNLYPQDIEEATFAHPAVRDGRAVAFGLQNPELGTEDLIVVAEVEDPEWLENRTALAVELRQSILTEVGVAPRAVHLVPPKWIVKSTAGKPARATNREKFLVERLEFRSRSKDED